MNPQELSDHELYKLCCHFGSESRKWHRAFAYLLPEVTKRELYRKHGCSGPFEFAAKTCGMSFDVCKRILLLAKRYKNIPRVWASIRNHGWTKLQTIVEVVNEKNQDMWIENMNRCTREDLRKLVKLFVAEKPRTMPDKSLRKARSQKLLNSGNEGPSQKTLSKTHLKILKFQVDEVTNFKFKELKQKLERKHGALTMGEVLSKILKMLEEKSEKIDVNYPAGNSTNNPIVISVQNPREISIGNPTNNTWANSFENSRVISIENSTKNPILKSFQNPREISTGIPVNNPIENLVKKPVEIPNGKNNDIPHVTIIKKRKIDPIQIHNNDKSPSRHIPAAKKRQVYHEQNRRCKLGNCDEPISELHHSDRWAQNKNHINLVGLCHSHHRLTHGGFVDEQNWKLNFIPIHEKTGDELVRRTLQKYQTATFYSSNEDTGITFVLD